MHKNMKSTENCSAARQASSLKDFLVKDISAKKEEMRTNTLIYAITCDCIHRFNPSK